MPRGVFEERTRLKDLILTILRDENAASISGVQKRLARHGEDFHRLIVTGYLRAMHDVGLVEERDVPPSKVYSLKAGPQQRDLYAAAGEAVGAKGLPRAAEAKILVAVLSRLFHRPVFKQELARAGVDAVGLTEWEVETKDRQSARQLLVQAGFDLPHNNPAYLPPDRFDPELAAHRDELLSDLVVRAFAATSFVLRNKQTTLREM